MIIPKPRTTERATTPVLVKTDKLMVEAADFLSELELEVESELPDEEDEPEPEEPEPEEPLSALSVAFEVSVLTDPERDPKPDTPAELK